MQKQSPTWKYSFCQVQHHFRNICVLYFYWVDIRIARIFLSIRTAFTMHVASQHLCYLIPKSRSQPVCISSTNHIFFVLMALTSTFLLERSWMSPLRVMGVFTSEEQAPSEVDVDSSYSRLSFGDLVRQATKSPWWNVERTGC